MRSIQRVQLVLIIRILQERKNGLWLGNAFMTLYKN